jgi:hypothetical protein
MLGIHIIIISGPAAQRGQGPAGLTPILSRQMLKSHSALTTLLFPLKGLEILNQERRGQVKPIVMEYYNGILFH